MHDISRSGFIRGGVAAGASALSLRRAVAAAQTNPTNVRVIYFPGALNLPIWVAISQGHFAREGLSVALTPTPDSEFLFRKLSAGDFDVAFTAFDNVVAYDEGQGTVALPKPADFVAFIGRDDGMLRLIARPEIRSYVDLKGKVMAVDALTTGFAFVLRRMLEANGLRDGDYTLAPAGGTQQRYKALTESDRFAATLLFPPFDVEARDRGFTLLGDARDVIGPYEGNVGATTRAWLAANSGTAVRFTRGYLAALGWLFDPANKPKAIQILAADAKLAPELAASVCDVIVDPRAGGISPTGALDPRGVKTVLALRSEYGVPRKTLTDPTKYYDAEPIHAARSGD